MNEKREKIYHDLFDSAPVGFIALTPKGLVARANRAAEEMLAGPGKVLTGKGFSRWIHVKDHSLYFSCLRKAADSGGRHACEVRLTGRYELLRARITAGAHFDEAGNVAEWLLTVSDLPEREETELALRRSEQHLRNVLNSTVAIIGVMTPQGALIEANRIALEAADLKSEDVLGKPLEESYWWSWSPEVQTRLCEAIELAAAGQGSRYHEKIRVGEGRFRTIDFMLSPMFGPDGSVACMVASASDITELKRSEEKLRKTKEELESRVTERSAELANQRALLQKIVDNIPVMIFFYNAEDILYLNRTALETIGISDPEIKDVDILERCYPDPLYRKEVIEFMMAAPPQWKEFRMVVRDGKEIETCWSNIQLPDGTYVGIGMDIAERKAAERKIQHYVEELERRNKTLGKLSSELTLSEQRERQRLAGVLHDHLQQFLVAARMNCETLFRNVPEEHKRDAENVLNLVTLSIQTSRSLTAELSPPVLPKGGLSDALQWLARWMEENHGLKIELLADPALNPEREDLTVLLFQSVRELLLNVVKHAKVKSARLIMSGDTEGRLRVAVMDRGPGFDLDTLWRRAQAGTGFGLFSIRERLTLMGGRLEVESSPGGGAAFALIAPLETKEKKGEA